MAPSIAASSRTGASVTVTPKDGAAAWIARLNGAAKVVSGLNMTVTRVTLGAISLNSCSHFPMIGAS